MGKKKKGNGKMVKESNGKTKIDCFLKLINPFIIHLFLNYLLYILHFKYKMKINQIETN